METKLCKKCQKELSIHHFSKFAKYDDRRRGTCNICVYQTKKSERTDPLVKAQRAKQSAQTRDRNRKYIYDFLSQNVCADCGISNMIVLEFDHVRGKTRQISNALHLSLVKLQEEIDKCDIVCRNCHCIRTYERMDKCNRLEYSKSLP